MSEPPLRVFLVDDEAPARLRLKALLEDIADACPSEVVGEADNGREALHAMAALAADPARAAQVALVDIRMPHMDGIELARHVTALPAIPAVVFCTAYDQYALQAFDLNAVDYLLKPVRAQRLQAALEKARLAGPLGRELLARLDTEGRKHLSCNERGRILLVPLADILYLKAELKYVTARTAERDFLLEESLVNLEQEFATRFVRIHRNCLVARDAIAGFERATGEDGEAHWDVLLKGLAERLAVSRRQWAAVKEAVAANTR